MTRKRRRLYFVALAALGLRPENVQDGIRAIGPDIVDVSSGVESAPGLKDPALIEAFAKEMARP